MPKSVIVVLGKGISENGTLTEESRLNVERAVEMQNSTKYPMIMCGRWSYTYDYVPAKTESEAMSEHAIELGADGGSVFKEERSLDTLGNAFFAKRIIREMRGIDSIVVVAVDYHINRSKYIFERIFGDRYRLSFVGVKSLDAKDLARKQQFEDETLAFLKRILDPITPGDDVKLQDLFDRTHPLYARDPKTVPEWVWSVFESKGIDRKTLIARTHKGQSRSA